MTDRDTLLMALAAAIVAGFAPGVPWWSVLVVGAVALALRRPALVALAIVLLVGARSHDAIAGLAGARAGSVSGSITVLSDPSRVPDVAVLTAALRRDLGSAAR